MSNWYVRPAGGTYGDEDGTSYNDAWDGLYNVVWGSGGVVAGDTLWVCGFHSRDDAPGSKGYSYRITPSSGSGESTRVIIRGDYPGDPAIIWGGCQVIWGFEWTEDQDGAWYATLPANFNDAWFRDVNGTEYTALTPVESIALCRSTADSCYSDGYGQSDALYVHLSGGGDPSGRIWAGVWGYNFYVGECSYITFLNFIHYCKDLYQGFSLEDAADHILFQGCTFIFGRAFFVPDGSSYIDFYDNEIGFTGDGVYSVGDDNDVAHHVYVRNNYIHDLFGEDAHAAGFQGGHDHLVEHNIIERCGTAICFYAFINQDQYNNTVRYNFIRDADTSYGASGHGIEWSGDSTQNGDRSSNQTYYNIVKNCVNGIKVKQSGSEHKLYNNVVANSTDNNYVFYDSNGGDGCKIKMRNNVSLDPAAYHAYYTSSLPNEYIDSDYNIFHDDTGTKFYYKGTQYSFTNWKTQTGGDSNSLTDDPLFLNAGGSYNLATDFKIPSNSPCKEAGTGIGLSEDFWGTSIPQGTYPDIGIHEYGGEGLNISAGAGSYLIVGPSLSLEKTGVNPKIKLKHMAVQ